MFDSATLQAPHKSLGRPPSRPLVGTALIAEDHPDIRDLLSLILERLGYAVLEAADGEQALQLAASARPNLIVTDLGMPVMNGLEFVERLRPVLSKPHECHVIMLTAYDRQDCAEDALKAGCDAILSKPVDLDQLESLISSFPAHSTTRIH
jgi:two-component system, cell cycle response regulator DivK